ncbi:putative holin-like toxin [Virgibacillus natechei]|nr:putative holin-like toxin [Virgibacillus natechei]UZD11953.1 putative holin-like toxin [Virgibacillus natechei]
MFEVFVVLFSFGTFLVALITLVVEIINRK